MARPVFGGWPTRPDREDHNIHAAKDGLRKSQIALWSSNLIDASDLDLDYPLTTAGDIAAINLESGRQQSWRRFWLAPLQPGIAECIVEQEQLTAQFLGDIGALDRLETLVSHLTRAGADSSRTALIHAQVSSMAHRFSE